MGNAMTRSPWQAFLPLARRILQAERLVLITMAGGACPWVEPADDERLPELPSVAAGMRPHLQQMGAGSPRHWQGASTGMAAEADDLTLWACWRTEPTADQVDRLAALVELAKTLGQAQAERAFRDGLARTLTHELRTPLTVIQGYLDLLVSDKPLPKGLQESALAAMKQQAGRLQHLIREFAQAGEGRESVGPAEIESLPDLAVALLLARGYIVTPPPAGLTLPVASEITRHMLRSLTNAVQLLCRGATPPRAAWEGEGHEMVLAIEVACPKPPLDEIRRVLDRRPAVQAQARPGWSLSLAAAHQLMQRQGGRMQVDYQEPYLVLRLHWPIPSPLQVA